MTGRVQITSSDEPSEELNRGQYIRVTALKSAIEYNSGRPGTPRQEVLRDAEVFETYILSGEIPD